MKHQVVGQGCISSQDHWVANKQVGLLLLFITEKE